MFLRSLDRRYPSTVASNGYDQTLARVRVAFLERLCLDLDAPTIAMAAARVNRKALEVQEDLYPVLRKLNPQLLMAVRYGERCRTLLLPARSSRGVASLRSTRRCQSHLLATP